MSYFSSGPGITTAENTVLTNLVNLPGAGAGTAISKNPDSTFSNVVINSQPSMTLAIGNNIGASKSGGVLYVDSSKNLAEDTSNLFWDSTNKRLGIAQGAPTSRLHLGTTSDSAQNLGILLGDVSIWRTSVNTLNIAGVTQMTLKLVTGGDTTNFTQGGGTSSIWSSGSLTIGSNGSGSIGIFLDTSRNVTISNKLVSYNGVATVGWGSPAIYGRGRSTAQTAAVASVATYTVGAADGSFQVSANVNVTTATAHSFTVTCTYTDETNTSQTLTFGFTQLTGSTFLTAITNVTGTGPYESPVFHIRAKAATAITIATTGTFTTVTYNVEGNIIQTA